MIETGSLHTQQDPDCDEDDTLAVWTRDTWHVTRDVLECDQLLAQSDLQISSKSTHCAHYEAWSGEQQTQTQTHNLETRNKFRVSGGRSFIILSPASHPGWSRRAWHIWRHNATHIDWALQNFPNWELIQAGAMWWEYLFSVVLVLRGRAGNEHPQRWKFHNDGEGFTMQKVWIK